MSGTDHPGWKGEDAGYSAIHQWVRKNKSKPTTCPSCGGAPTEWANVSGEYKRDLDDWIALCRKCHRAFDRKEKCPKGHPRVEANLFIDGRGIAKCRACKNLAWKARYYRLKNQR